MGDIKLFRTRPDEVTELQAAAVGVEKALQNLIERHLEAFLGVTFLESEYSTGATHGGRMDTLSIDENFNPVIIEYTRSTNQNVINQGLFYLDWLMDHRAEFTLLAMKKLGSDVESKIDWTNPRLICIAGDFTRYDERRVADQPEHRAPPLPALRRRVPPAGAGEQRVRIGSATGTATSTPSDDRTVADYLKSAPTELRQLYSDLDEWIMTLGDDVILKELKNYFAYRRIKNFACVEGHPQARKLTVYVKVNPDEVDLDQGFVRDVRNIGHFGTGDLELTVTGPEELDLARPLIEKSYEAS
jgi:predicted transport protein